MSITSKLMKIQTEIKAPKNLYNSFGKYKYRNAEGICEAVKPYLTKYSCSLVLSDDIIIVGERIYVKATATLTDIESGETTSVSAMARESEEKKGMDESQITGTASSYARKYALNGLFLLYDTKDADSDEHHVEAEEKKKRAKEEEEHSKAVEDISKMKISKIKVDALADKAVADGVPLKRIIDLYKIPDLESMTEKMYRNCMDNWKKIVEMK